jgi:hypothetical protein
MSVTNVWSRHSREPSSTLGGSMRHRSRVLRLGIGGSNGPQLRLTTVAVQMSYAAVVSGLAILEDVADQARARFAARSGFRRAQQLPS